jgi:hypothetical protein
MYELSILIRAVVILGLAAGSLVSAEQLALCGFCTSYVKLMMAGAKVAQFETKLGSITLMTSTDPEVVKMIQGHGRHATEDYEKVLAAGGFKSS